MNVSATGRLHPLIQTYAKVLERAAICIETLLVGSVYSHELRSEVQYLTELDFLSSDLFLGALLFAQIQHERNAIFRILKQCAANQHGHAAAVLSKKLLLVRLKNPGCQRLHQDTLVALAPFGRSQVRPAQSTRAEILTAVLQHS